MSKDTTKKCEVRICKNPAHTRNLCQGHYKRLQVTGDVRPEEPLRVKSSVTNKGQRCAVKKCRHPAKTRGWCGTHYSRWRRTGTTDDPKPRTKQSSRSCSYGECPNPASQTGLCSKHYTRRLRHGDLEFTMRPTWEMTAEDRFWFYVDKEGPVVVGYPELGPCWTWTGTLNSEGYGSFYISVRNSRGSHRVAYEWLVGPIPDGHVLDHLCHTFATSCECGPYNCPHRRCCNPLHLEPVPPEVNSERGNAHPSAQIKKRGPQKTHCIHGHEYTPENTYYTPGSNQTKRSCLTCRRFALRKSDWRRAGLELPPDLPVILDISGSISADKLAERDKWICGICNDPIDQTLGWPDLGYRTIDHVVRITAGGTHSWDNTRIAHFGCNISRNRLEREAAA